MEILRLPNLSLKKGKYYWYSVMRNGNREWRKVGSIKDSHEKLLREYNRVAEELEDRRDKLQSLAKVWLSAREREVNDGLLSLKTHDEYRKIMEKGKRLDKAFGHRYLDTIEPWEVQHFLDGDMIPEGQRVPRYMLNREIAALSTMLNWGINRGYVRNNPTLTCKRNPEKGRDRYVTDDEYDAMFKVQPLAVSDAMEIIYLTGLRVGDVLRLTFKDSVFDEWLYAEEGKTGKHVRFMWSERLRKVVENSRKRQPLGEHIVRRPDGQPYQYFHLAKTFRSHAKEANEKYDLRGKHAIATDWSLKDLRAKHATDRDDPQMASYALGHSDQQVTNKHYLRNQRGRLVMPLDYPLGS